MTTPSSSTQGHPVDVHGFVRQCAWCRRIADTEGNYRTVSAILIHGASHGCCEACAIRFLSRGIRPSLPDAPAARIAALAPTQKRILRLVQNDKSRLLRSGAPSAS